MNAPRLSTILALVAAACANAQQAAVAPQPGCWYFVQDADARALALPWGVRLDDSALTGWPALAQREGVRRAATLTPGGDADHPFGYWARLAGDSVEIGYPAGGGVVLRLAVDGDTLRGTARPVGDALPIGGGARPVRSVRLTRAQCPSR